MKIANTNRQLSALLLAVTLACVSHHVLAQSIEVKNQAYEPSAPLLFAPAKGASPVVTAEPTPRQVVAVSTETNAPVQKWEILLKDINLANTMQRWADDAGWRVRWDARKNFMVEAPDMIQGTFEDAIRTVLESPGIAGGAYPLEVCFYPNTPPLARITRKGEQEKECK